jgi:hypothetical protein
MRKHNGIILLMYKRRRDMKNIILGFLAIICICGFTACGKNSSIEQPNISGEQTSTTNVVQNKPISQETPVSTPAIPFRDYPDVAQKYAEEGLKKSVSLSFGEDVNDIKVTDINVYFDDIKAEEKASVDDIDKIDEVQNSTDNDKIYFEATFDILLSETADPNYYVTSGHYDESTNWVSNIKASGDLVYDGNSLNMEHFDIIS